MKKIKYFQIGGVALPEDKSYVDGQVILNPRSIKTRNFWDKLTPWRTQNENDLKALYERGFIYQGEDGKLYQAGKSYESGNQGDWKQFAGNIKDYNEKAERAARLRALYGESPQEQEANVAGDNVRREMDRGANYVTITPRTYSVAISKGRMTPVYKALLQALYNNKNHNVLRQMSLDNKITDDTLKTYLGNNELTTEYLKGLGLDDQQSANILNLMPKDPNNLPVITTGTIPENFKATDYSAFSTGLDANAADYNSRLYNRVLGYRNAHNLEENAPLPSDLGNMRFHNDYYVYRQGDEDFYSGPTDIYDASGKKRQKVTTTTIQKKGGIMKYFQAGGAVNQQQVNQEQTVQQREFLKNAFTAAAKGDLEGLAKMFGIQNQQQLNQFVQIATKISKQKDADPEMANLASQALIGLQQAMSIKAAKGTKLQYFQRLNGKCPEGYELKMLKIGGKVCKKCQKIEEACKGKKMEEGGESPIVQQFKNGRKCKK